DMTIKASAFKDLSLKSNPESIVLPSDKLTKIESNAFNNVTLTGTSFVLPEGVKQVGADAFKSFKISNGTLRINGSTITPSH
ncbi:MAG: leucine-rich repeat protein, partial [Oscillospiraceae bacterium]|nr:leucine-rich repeat protein [Oscillospiraceae bacterium]